MQRKIVLGIAAIVVAAAVGLAWWSWDQGRQALGQAAAAATAQAEAVAQRDAAQAAQATAVAGQGQAEAAAAAAASEARARATTEAAALQSQATAEQRYQAALAQKLGAQAQLRLDDTADPTLGALLAVESLSRSLTLEGDSAARRGIGLLAWQPIFKDNKSDYCGSTSLSADGKRVAIMSMGCRYPEGAVVTVSDVDASRALIQMNLEDSKLTSNATLSPDGHWLAIASGYYTLQVLDVDTHEQVMTQTIATGKWGFSPDSRRLAVISDDKTVSVWDLSARRAEFQLPHEQKVVNVVFGPDNHWIAAQGETKIWLWDATTRQLAQSYEGSQLAFSANGQLLAAINQDTHVVHIWDVAKGLEIMQAAPGTWITRVALSPDGRWLAVLGADKTVQVWETATGLEVTRIQLQSARIFEVAFSPEGRWLATGGEDGMTRLWETGSWQESARIPGGLLPSSFSADGNRMVLTKYGRGKNGIDKYEIWMWQKRPGELQGAAVPPGEELRRLVFSPECASPPEADAERCDRWLATSQSTKEGKNASIRVWDMATGAEIAQLKPGGDWLSRFVFSSECGSSPGTKAGGCSRRIIAGNNTGTLTTWDVASGREITHTALGEAAKTILAFSRDGRRMVTVDDSPAKSGTGEVKMWDVAAGREIASMDLDSFPIWDVQATFSPDGHWAAVMTGKSALLWDVSAPHAVVHLADDQTSVSILNSSAVFSPDSRLLVANQGAAVVWDVATGQEVRRLPPRYGIEQIIFTPDGSSLAVASGSIGLDGKRVSEIQVWDVATWREVIVIDSGQAQGMSVSPDGRWVAMSTDDATKVWEVSTGREVAHIIDRYATRSLFSPGPACDSPLGAKAEQCGGRWLVTAAYDHFSVWAWQPADMIAQACDRLARNLTRAEWRLYLGDEPYRATCPALPPADGE